MQRTPLKLGCKEYNRIEEGIRKSYPNACILWIDEIFNNDLEDKFLAQQLEIEEQGRNIKLVELYHGTSEQAITSIVTNGFRVSMNKTSAYGRGTYFAKNANYSVGYMKPSYDKISFMMLCEVIVGTCATYTSGWQISTKHHDNSVDRIKDPTIYVTPYDYGAIPRYVIAFYTYMK